MESIFTKIYEKKIWGNGSGAGSSPNYNKKYLEFLKAFMLEKNIKTVLDIGCGDWQFSKHIDWSNQSYIGVDCVKDVIAKNIELYSKPNISFIHLDTTKSNELPEKIDLVILKDILQHWDNETIVNFMDDLTTRGHKYILTINNYREAKDINRNVNNRYNYAKIDAEKFPLNKYNPKVIGYYKYKQIALIS